MEVGCGRIGHLSTSGLCAMHKTTDYTVDPKHANSTVVGGGGGGVLGVLVCTALKCMVCVKQWVW